MASNIVKDEIKELELLTKDLKLTEQASTPEMSAEEACASTVPSEEACASTVPSEEACASTVPSEEACAFTDPSEEAFAMLAQKKYEFLMADLQKIADDKKDSNQLDVKELNEWLTSDMESISWKETLDEAEKSVDLKKRFEDEYKEYFDDVAPVLNYVISDGTSHLPLINQKQVYVNLLIVRQDIRYRSICLCKVKSKYENVQAFLGKMTFSAGCAELNRAARLAITLSRATIALDRIIEYLGKYEDVSTSIIERLEAETGLKLDVPPINI